MNIRIANCTTAAQYFHVLRRQAALLKTDPLPLVVLTPKSLLRHPLTSSSPHELAEGSWQPVLDDVRARHQPDPVRRLVLCSGKVYVDLVTSDLQAKNSAVAMARVEQVCPFPTQEVKAVVEAYPNLEEVVWLQEEPANMGAWTYIQPRLAAVIKGRWPLRFIGRSANSSPAEGSSAWHARTQQVLIEHVYDLNRQIGEEGVTSTREG